MNFCILMGSPRLKGNTATTVKPLIKELKDLGASVEYIAINKFNIKPCQGCYTCQSELDRFGCPQNDDMELIVQSVRKADVLIFATPIFSWYCTPGLKAVLDRLVYGMNKFYGSKATSSLWEGKKCALVTTHGYEREYGAGPFEMGIKRYCEHSKLIYQGMYSVRHITDTEDFKTDEVINGVKAFARELYNKNK